MIHCLRFGVNLLLWAKISQTQKYHPEHQRSSIRNEVVNGGKFTDYSGAKSTRSMDDMKFTGN